MSGLGRVDEVAGSGLFDWSAEARGARERGAPIVALESTIIAHGLPYPTNLEVAMHIEGIVRDAGATPATIAIQDGRAQIGLDPSQLERLAGAAAKGPFEAAGVRKASRRDLPILLALRESGATTVAATALLAARAGIAVFATGGIGGVHRGGVHTLDISADLTELATSPVAVVCAGAKSILDIGLTLERLETLGVPVISYQSDHFPAFYSRTSGFLAPSRCDTVAELAGVVRASRLLRLESGILIANPIPAEHEIPLADINPVIERAERERAAAGISGSAATPFLLARIAELTDGASIAANKALIYHNARLAGQLAAALGNEHH